MITPINQIASIAGGQQAQGVKTGTAGGGDSVFASVFRSAIDNVRETERDVAQAEYLMATGQLDNPAVLSIAETKSGIALDVLIQLRNRSLEAYSELTRINL